MGATYTRQSSYADGDVITAAHTNDEFNQLLAAFQASTGHTHDGTANEGGPITKLLGTSITIGDATSGTDITVTFDGESNDGVLKWMEDEDYFEFSDDILVASTEKIQFRDTAIYINSSTDGQLDLVADTEIQIAATTIDINGNVDVSGTLTVAGAVDFGDAALSNVGAVQLDSIAGDGDTNTSITFSGSDVITVATGGTTSFTVDASQNILMSAAKKVQFRDSAISIHSSADGQMDIAADSEVQIDTATLDINASNGTVMTGGMALTGNAVFGSDVDIAGDLNVDGTVDIDASTIDIDSTSTLSIDNSNTTNGITIGTATSGVPISIGHSTSETTVNDNLTVTGDLTVNGTTTTVNSTTVTIDDPIFTLGGDSAPGSDDNKDRGIEFRYHDGSSARVGFFGYDDSASAFTFLTAATNSSEVFSGTAGNVTAGVGTFSSLDISGDIDVNGTTNLDVVDIDGAVDFASTTAHAGNATFADNAKAIFGAGSDLQIYHDGSHSYISDQGTGDLRVLAGTSFVVKKADASENMITANADGAVGLSYDGSAKLATASGGISITGNASFADDGKALFGAGDDLQIYHDGSNSKIISQTGSLTINAKTSEAAINIAADGAVTLYHDNAAKLATASGGVTVTGTVTSDGLSLGDFTDALTIGDSNDLSLYHASGSATIKNDTGDLTVRSDSFRVKNNANNEEMFSAYADGAVTLFHNNESKLNTQATGINVTGTVTSDGLTVDGAATFDSDTVTIQSTNTTDPVLIIKQKTSDGTSSRLHFVKDGGRNGANGDDLAEIDFIGDDAGQNQTTFGRIEALIASAADGSEGGKIRMRVATHDGEMQTGFEIIDGSAEDEIDVNIANGTSSLTSVAGNLDVAGNAVIDGTLTSSGGLVHQGDTNTSLDFGTDQQTFYVGGVRALDLSTSAAVFNEGSADVDFRVESNDNTHMLFVDAANGKIGINQTEPSRQLHITDTIANGGASLGLTSSDSSTTGSMGILHFGNSTDSSLASINGLADGSTSAGALLFKTEAAGAAIEERMRINSVGSVGIGVADGDVTNDGTAARTYVGIIGTANRGRLNIGSTASNGADAGMLAFTNGSNVLGSIVVDTAAGAQTLGTMYVTSTGNLDIRAAANYGVIINEGSVDADFRVESNGNANMLVVDGGDDSVRVGGASGESGDTFSVVESGANVVNSRFRNGNDDANGVRVVFEKASANPANNDEIAQLDFLGRDSAGNAELYAGIQCFIDDVTSSTEDGILRFGTITNSTYRNRLDILPTETVFNQDGVSINFRVETDNSSNTFFVDGGNDRVYVGDNTGTDLFYITGKAESTAMGIKIGTNGYNAIEFDNATGSLVGRITTSSGSTAYVTSSDYRLKENVADMTGATARLKQLKPKRFNWISDDTNTPLDGFLAHEVSSVVPEAVAGEKDAVHPDGHHEAGQIDPQGIDHSKLVPLLVKTIQELEARITTLEG